MTTALQTLTTKLAATLDMGAHNGAELVATLKATAFKGGTQVSDAQMTALMVVANQYGLNPWTKEIYAFPDKGGIVPVVGVDGWARIINNHPQFDGIEFEQDDQSCTAIIYRKDRSRPIKVTEYMAECKRANTGPWQSHPKRMLRHKAMIQCARLAFGYGGIHDPEEAEQIAGPAVDMSTGEILTPAPAARSALEAYPSDRFEANLPSWRGLVESGKKTPEQIRSMVASKATLTEAQLSAIANLGAVDVQPKAQPAPTPAPAPEPEPAPEPDEFVAALADDENDLPF